MLRFLFAVLTLLLFVGTPSESAPVSLLELVAQVDDDCGCCDEEEGEDGDCCDVDLGACCSTGVVAALPTLRQPVAEHQSSLHEAGTYLPVQLMTPRNNGPPPLPPPIG